MRTLVDIPEPQIKALDQLAMREKSSRAALIRKAVDNLLDSQKKLSNSEAFGLWTGKEDGLAYQEKVRSEW